jgi:hypothetical protein
MKILLSKKVALISLYENKENHVNTYEETLRGWEMKLEEYTVKLNNWAKNGGQQGERPSEPPKPKDYTEEYDKLIKQLEYHQAETIEVEEYDFDQIINDKFSWSSGFLTTNSMYTSR